ncbi:MAG: DUF4430 domain-containing protein [Candidatus Thorarchaeota archaeon]|nr:DUF4430 domain-containing protein [Candidatus Thorarchaeota archaeon]
MTSSRLRVSLVFAMIAASLFPLGVNAFGTSYTLAATGISLAINFGNGTIHEFSNLEGTNVYEVTNSTAGAEGEWYGNLIFVTSVSGVSESDEAQQYWHYKVNGELGGSAANVYLLEDNDSIEWVLSSPNPNVQTTPVQPIVDYSLILGAAILGGVSILVLIVLWARQYKG